MVSFVSFWLLSALSFSGIFCLGSEEEKVQVVDLVAICKGRNHKVHVNPTIAIDQKRGLLDWRHLQLTVKVFMKLFLLRANIGYCKRSQVENQRSTILAKQLIIIAEILIENL